MVNSIEAPDPADRDLPPERALRSFLWNLARPAIGIVPAGSGADFAAHPIGTGPFRFVSAQQDEEVVLERNPNYFRTPPTIERVRFSASCPTPSCARSSCAKAPPTSNPARSPPTWSRAAKTPALPSPYSLARSTYIAINFRRPRARHREVRQALAYATDRESIIRYLLRGEARVADGVLPPNSWAYEPNVTHYPYDPARAEHLLDAAGFPRRAELGNMRLHLVLKTSTEESSRTLGAVLQDQWRRVGIDLELRSLEAATLYADITRGSFQLYTCAGSAETTIPTSSNSSSVRTACRPTAPTAATTAIPASTPCSTRPASLRINRAAAKCSPKSSASSPRTSPTLICGISTTSASTASE